MRRRWPPLEEGVRRAAARRAVRPGLGAPRLHGPAAAAPSTGRMRQACVGRRAARLREGAARPPPVVQEEPGRAGGVRRGREKEKEHNGSGESKDEAAAMPAVPRAPNTTVRDEEGAPICFKFNVDEGCSAAPPGGRCPKGRHVCVEERPRAARSRGVAQLATARRRGWGAPRNLPPPPWASKQLLRPVPQA